MIWIVSWNQFVMPGRNILLLFSISDLTLTRFPRGIILTKQYKMLRILDIWYDSFQLCGLDSFPKQLPLGQHGRMLSFSSICLRNLNLTPSHWSTWREQLISSVGTYTTSKFKLWFFGEVVADIGKMDHQSSTDSPFKFAPTWADPSRSPNPRY